ncbi:MAG TPA: hypothetical protein VFZ34_28875 [Blastocatellia bacterium]|nr:hypothetical protein [Blastocatellia bacterium]
MTSLSNTTLAAIGIARANTGYGVEKITPLSDRTIMPRSVEPQKATLPSLATANDLRDLVRYLKKYPDGVTIVEALGEVKKRILDPRKISAYETWGVVERQGDWMKLSALGWEFSRKLAAEATLFRSILDQKEHYRSVLEHVHAQQLKLITHEDVARFWRAHYADALDLHQPKTIESNVVCFLHLCQAAELGSLTVGKRGQPARLRVEMEEIGEFIHARWDDWGTELNARPELRPLRPTPTNLLPWEAGSLRVCLSLRLPLQNAAQLQSLLELIGMESDVLERSTTATLTMSESAFETMRRCDAGLFVVTPEDCLSDEQGRLTLRPEVQAEISAAYLFYNRRILLLWDEHIPLPADWQHLTHITFTGTELSWEAGLQLTKALQNFKR